MLGVALGLNNGPPTGFKILQTSVKDQRLYKTSLCKSCGQTGRISLRHACQLPSVQGLLVSTQYHTFEKIKFLNVTLFLSKCGYAPGFQEEEKIHIN